MPRGSRGEIGRALRLCGASAARVRPLQRRRTRAGRPPGPFRRSTTTRRPAANRARPASDRPAYREESIGIVALGCVRRRGTAGSGPSVPPNCRRRCTSRRRDRTATRRPEPRARVPSRAPVRNDDRGFAEPAVQFTEAGDEESGAIRRRLRAQGVEEVRGAKSGASAIDNACDPGRARRTAARAVRRLVAEDPPSTMRSVPRRSTTNARPRASTATSTGLTRSRPGPGRRASAHPTRRTCRRSTRRTPPLRDDARHHHLQRRRRGLSTTPVPG